ncbi:hypothetical protein AB0K67_31520 [Nonomuraea sp. NPDC052634]|uniref:hypothetical protein n=1 Tax=Nonomuraea sp. NPDC052634 TaxID=3155813 RepID=UPI00342DA66D
MAEELAFAESRRRPATPDDGFLHALLSYAALAGRAPTVDFLAHRLATDLPPDRRTLLCRHLCELFSRALMTRQGSAFDAYQPVRAEVTARCAAYAANLMLLAVLTAGGPLTGAELFQEDQQEHANERWRRMARLWQSQLTRAEWDALTRTVKVRHQLRDGIRTLEVSFERDAEIDVADLAFFTWPGSGAVPSRRVLSSQLALDAGDWRWMPACCRDQTCFASCAWPTAAIRGTPRCCASTRCCANAPMWTSG